MTQMKLQYGCSMIAARIPGFDYAHTLEILRNPALINTLYHSCQTGYEKLQVFRLLQLEVDNRVIRKFVNETYHIENEFICQLDPARFDLIPEYVIAECDKLLTPPVAANDEVGQEIA
ncbi:Uncharacterised protein [Yersinia intermedia]|nr:Uncharacterised protein [Yersinia intermedia]